MNNRNLSHGTTFLRGTSCARYALAFFLALAICSGQTFSVSSAPAALTIYPGQQGVPVTVTVSAGGYSGPVVITLTGLPSGISVSPLTITGSGAGILTLSASVSAGQEGFSAVTLPTNISWTAPVTVIAAAGSAQTTTQLPLTISTSNSSFAPAAAALNLPVININTNGVPVVTKTDSIPGTITITSADGQTSYLPNASDTDNTANFHVHGTSTSVMPKLSYHISLNTSLDLLNTMGLVCPYVTSKKVATCDKSKSYHLLANFDDKTFLRDWSASALANAIPIGGAYLNSTANSPTPSGTSTLLPWAPHSLFVELYLNGVYEGNYQLIEEVKVDSHRVNITELSQTDTSPAQITGGYLMEIDTRQDEDYVFVTPHGVPVGLIDPDFTPDPNVPEQTSYISTYVDKADSALFASNFTDPAQGWRAYFDEASAVNFYIVNDVMGNVDGGAFTSSVYLYKDINNPLLYMGPVWDFDISAGNVNYQPIVSPVIPWMQSVNVWYSQWFSDPGFRADVVTQWNALKSNGVFSAWLASIRQQAATLEQSQANNFGRWPMQGIEVWPNSEAAGSYDGEINNLTGWLTLRMAYLDSIFNKKAATQVVITVPAGTLRSGAAITLTAQVSGGVNPTGMVSFLYNGILIGSSALSGGVASFVAPALPAGTYTLQAVYQGDNTNALAVSASPGVTVAAALATTAISLAGPFSDGFSVSVTGNSGRLIPTGTVTFAIDSGVASAVTLDTAGRASYTTPALASGAHTLTASYSGDSTYLASKAASLNFQSGNLLVAPTLSSANPPTVTGVANAASGGQAAPEVVAPGSYVSIYGTGLAGSGSPSATSTPLPTTLNGTQVLLGGIPMPLFYAGTSQINALVPQSLSPGASYPLVVSVAGSGQSLPLSLTVTELQPGIYTLNQSGVGPGVVTNAFTGALNGSSNPAHAGDYLTIYCTGLGALSDSSGQAQPGDGAAAPASDLFYTGATITATIGGLPATVTFSGLAPNFAGLYQVNIQVPVGSPTGNAIPLTLGVRDPVTAASGVSNAVAVSVQ